MLLYMLSHLGSICLGLASAKAWLVLDILSHLGSICQGLACYSISYHALAVSAEAWHATLYLITPWQYLPRLGMLFHLLSSLGSICRGLAFFSISYPMMITRWQHLPRLGMLFYLLSRLGSILYLITPWQYPQKDQPPKTQATKAQNPSYKSSR